MIGYKEYNVPAEDTDCYMYVNGNEVSYNGNGTGEYIVKENGAYDIEVRPYYYGEGAHRTITVNNIDRKGPEIEVKTYFYKGSIPEGGKAGLKVDIKSKDDNALKSVTFDGVKKDLTGYSMKHATFNAYRTSDYKIIVEDAAGNVTEKKQTIEVDTKKPVLKNVEIYKNNDKVTKTPCNVKIGDELRIRLTADEEIRGIRFCRFS